MEGIFFESTRHSSRRRAASMSRFVLLFWIDGAARRDARLEAELAAAPDGERVDGLLAREVLELGVDDLAVVQEDLARGARRRSRWKTPVFPLTLTSWMMSGR